MMPKMRQANPLVWLLLLLTAWACLVASPCGAKTASGNFYGPETASGEMTGWEAPPRLGFGDLTGKVASVPLVGENSVSTSYGLAVQSTTPESLTALQQVQNGATLYRAGTFGVQNTVGGQFWSFENPLVNPEYVSQMGMPGSNTPVFDWVMTGKLVSGANVITRPAPGLGINAGGQVEAVVSPGSINIQDFHMPSKRMP